ncbi:type II toxin-antitoxin system prevent-host-death family antitoxin [Parablautia intestinalis]
MQNNFGKYLNMVINGSEVIVTKNGKEIGRFILSLKRGIVQSLFV